MSCAVENELKCAGWFEGRRVPVDSAAANLRAAGYPVWKELVALLSEFSGLTVYSHDRSRSLWLDVDRALCYTDPGWVEAYRELIGQDLAPIGGYSHMTIFLSRDGMLYGGFDEAFGEIGSHVKEMVDGLLNRIPPVPLTMRIPAQPT